MKNGASKISTAQIGPRKDDESTLYIEILLTFRADHALHLRGSPTIYISRDYDFTSLRITIYITADYDLRLDVTSKGCTLKTINEVRRINV